jgi:PncC family amidohydrolase
MRSAGGALAAEAVRLATALGRTVGTAESLTAGLIAATLAEIPGASAVLMGGVVSYDPRVKREVLGVAQAVIDGPGVVSEACARQMAEGARSLLKVDIAVSATGLAGPSGGTPETPVGTVYIGLADARGTSVTGYRFEGNRQAVRTQTVEAALLRVLDSLKV